MSTKHFNGFEDFARRGPGMAKKEFGEVGTELVGLVLEAAAEKAQAVSPQGPDDESERRMAAKGGKGFYGHIRDNFFVSARGRGAGGVVPVSQVSALKGRLKPGMGATVLNAAAHFNVINRGRKRLKTGRMGGSTKARRGISKPTVEHVNAVSSSLKAKAVRNQEAKP